MPAPVAIAAAAKEAGKRILINLALDAAKPSSDGPNPIVVAVVGAAFVVLVGVFTIVSAPLAVWGMASDYIQDAFAGEQDPVYGQLDEMADEELVKWYINEADSLDEYAKGKWNSNTGEDVYSLPDWRYLAALDMAISENDFDLVKSRRGYYHDLHKGILMGRSSVKYRYVLATEETEGAIYSEEDGRYYVIQAYTIWSVSYKPLQSVFGRSGTGELSAEFRYFAEFECGEYGAGWGDQGNALGYYQFDRRYSLGPFLDYCLAQDPDKYKMFEPWAGGVAISAGDPGLESAWMNAYNKDPDAFATLQDRHEYTEKYLPAEDYLQSKGIDITTRRDCIKGLVCGIYNLFGSGGWQKFIHGLDNSMSDEQFATTLCNNVIDGTSGYQYAQSYQNRYRSELQTVLSLLASPATPGVSGSASVTVGSDPSAEGQNFNTNVKGALADNYRRALLAVEIETGPFGPQQVTYNHDRFVEAVTKATFDGKRPSTGNSDIVNAAMTKLGCPYVWAAAGPDAFDCSGLVTWAYAQIGVSLPHYTGDQLDRSTVIDEADAQPGDLVFQLFGGGTNAVSGIPGHVGIYIGDGQMIHAPTFGAVVRVDDVRVFDPNPVFARVN